MVDEVMKWLTGSASLNLVFLVLAITSFATSIHFYLRSKREKRPVFLTRQFPLVQKSAAHSERIRIRFDDHPVDELYVTKVALWNKGRETINRGDIVASDPPRIVLRGGEAIDAQVVFQRRSVNNISTSISGGEVLVEFDFLDKLDGAVLNIYHSTKCEVVVQGTVKGSEPFAKARIDDATYVERLLAPILKALFRVIPKPESGSVYMWLLLLAFTPIAFLAIPALFVEMVVQLFQPVPKEYSL